ncbi:MAG: hypothetical protein ABIZ34_06590, partial [Candidatus Limnocylindrales bacterium]
MTDGAPRIGDRLAWLELTKVWLVDPASGREGPGSLTVEEGVITSVEWAEAMAGATDGPTIVVAPGFVDLRSSPASSEYEATAAAHGGYVAVGHVAVGHVAVGHVAVGGVEAEMTDAPPTEANDGVPATILGLRATPAVDEAAAVA